MSILLEIGGSNAPIKSVHMLHGIELQVLIVSLSAFYIGADGNNRNMLRPRIARFWHDKDRTKYNNPNIACENFITT